MVAWIMVFRHTLHLVSLRSPEVTSWRLVYIGRGWTGNVHEEAAKPGRFKV